MEQKQIPLHFLCIGTDPSFLTALLEKSNHFDISLDTCKTAEEAHNKMEHDIYDIYVIDVHISEKNALDLVHYIKKKEKHKFLIAVVAGAYAEEETFSSLKDKGQLDFLLQKPITPQQLDHFLQEIAIRFAPPSLGPPTTEKLESLKKKYERSVPEKIEIITRLVNAAQQAPDVHHLINLKEELHKIGGSAGSYGYKAVSTLCKDMCTQISEKLGAGNITDKSWIASFPAYLKKITEAFSAPTLPTISSMPGARYVSKPSIYIIDHDTKFLDALEMEKDVVQCELNVESNPRKAFETLQKIDFNPHAIVATQTFPSTSLTAFDLFKIQRQKLTQKPTLFGLILEQENIDKRLEALQKGVNYIFRKPVYADVVLRTIAEGLSTRQTTDFKVLVLDDDPDFCNFVTIALSEIGISVRSITDPVELFATLEDYRPDLLLLDVILPKYDGLNLLKSIRQDITFQNLIVVVVTSGEESITRLSAYSARADDILYKPLDIEVLQTRVQSLAGLHKFASENLAGGNQSTLFNLKTLITKLTNSLDKPGRNKHLVVFEVNNFSDWLMNKDHPMVDELLSNINKEIRNEYEPALHNFSYNLSKFALVFDDKDAAGIEREMRDFLTRLVDKSQQHQLSFNCCIVPISKKFGSADQILHIAEICLNEANKTEPAPVRVYALTPESGIPSNKEVVLIDSDQELLKILRTAFEAHGITVHTYTEGEPALKNLLARDPEFLPSLIIVERKLIDMDGLDLIIQINDHFHTTVPFYVLSIFSSDKDISEGVKQGALEYIGKPFNLSILMQKALKTIES